MVHILRFCVPMRLLLTLLLGAGVVPGLVQAQPADDGGSSSEAVRQQLRVRVEAERRGLDALEARGEEVRVSPSVRAFYEQRRFGPVWVTDGGPRAAVDSLVAVLRRADRDGLRPADYHVDALQALLQRARQDGRRDAGLLSDLELLSTDAFLLYASHLLTGRLSPTEMSPSWNVPQRERDLHETLSTIGRTGRVSAAVESLRPPQPEYARLAEALQRYRHVAASGGWPSVPDGPTLKKGMSGDGVAALRRRLREGEGLTTDGADAAGSFDAALHEAVVAFQERHGLEPDGAVGAATRRALNVSAAERARQVAVNMERWRWLPRNLGRQHILVNIAGFSLQVVEDGEVVMQMRAITGRPYRQTPVFSGEISYLVLNPYWHVPHSIATEDKLPEIKKDPGYLARQQIKVFRGWGADAKPIDPSTIDWSRLSASTFPYRLRQDPGPLNALGRVKFMFPNPHSVYLHDTPTRGLFARAERSFSSGCVRVERPLDLAAYLLADHPQWSRKRVQATWDASSAEQSVTLPERVPVHLQYWTAWADDDGTVQFRNDVYSRDGAVQRALQASKK